LLQNDLSEPGTLCVSIHDVAPETWTECEVLLQAVRAVADIPLTWLVIPHYHGNGARSHQLENTLGHMLEHGHELALHGYTHLDDAPARAGPIGALVRNVYTEREGEFAAIDEQEAQRRIALGLEWFRERGWPVSGFVPPAWLMSPQAWHAIHAFSFLYTTTFTHFHLLEQKRELFSPSLVYAARNKGGRALSPVAASTIAYMLRDAPLVRFSLHPRDAHYPALVRHAQHLIARLLETRMPLTKAAFAQAYQ
jgi:predicted deacetylase